MWTDCKRMTRVSRVTIKIYRDRGARSPSIIVVQVFLQWYYKSNVLLHNIRDHSLLLINNSHAIIDRTWETSTTSFAQFVDKDLSGRIPRTITWPIAVTMSTVKEKSFRDRLSITQIPIIFFAFFLFIYFFGRARSERSFIRLFPITTFNF